MGSAVAWCTVVFMWAVHVKVASAVTCLHSQTTGMSLLLSYVAVMVHIIVLWCLWERCFIHILLSLRIKFLWFDCGHFKFSLLVLCLHLGHVMS